MENVQPGSSSQVQGSQLHLEFCLCEFLMSPCVHVGSSTSAVFTHLTYKRRTSQFFPFVKSSQDWPQLNPTRLKQWMNQVNFYFWNRSWLECFFSGPECVLKPPLNLMGQQQPQSFQPISPTQTLGPAPVLMPPEPLAFPHCSPLSAKPPPTLQLFPNPAMTAPSGSSPMPPESEFQATGSDQDTALEDLCRPLYCKLCNVTLNSPQQAQAHYQVKITYWYVIKHFPSCGTMYGCVCDK